MSSPVRQIHQENPEYDYCTVVSQLPFEVRTHMKSLKPGLFILPAAEKGTFSTLVIKPCKSFMYIDEGRGNIARPHAADDVAYSLIDDHWRAQLGASTEARPGIFHVRGIPTDDQIEELYSDELAESLRKQNLWFKKLVELADDDWKKYEQFKMIADIQRHAARSLHLERAWLFVPEEEVKIKCPACTTIVSDQVAVCPQCKVIINQDKYESLKFAT